MPKENLHSEKELLQLVAKGNTTAYQQLFDRYWDHVYGLSLRITKSPEQSKDMAQDIFMRLWNLRSKLPEVNNFRSYLFTITRNLIHDRIRTKIFQESNKEFLLKHFNTSQRTQQEILEQKERWKPLHAAIDQLPPKLHQVFTLSHLEGLSHREIGKVMHISPQSSKTYMVRALVILRKQFLKNQ